MGYQALLFCPDEKTARSVTQVLSELEFNVESCTETFAAVKKLMGEHFDAIVVDCDNEQNAALLFKSARNSASNQTSLAVAVVEGQAGVAKAFRIGANLVLTKPINVEQAKGTLRVARGLLRRGEAAKTTAPTAATGTPSAPAAAPVKPAAGAPVSPAKPAASVLRPVAPPLAKPAAVPIRSAAVATASPALIAQDQKMPAGKSSESATRPAAAAPVASPAATKVAVPPPSENAPAAPVAPAPVAEAKPGLRPVASAVASASSGSGAASAPAPAREILDIPPVEVLPSHTDDEADNILESPAAEPPRESAEPAREVPPPSFTLGGASAPKESSGRGKKIALGLAAAGLVAAGLYAGWPYFGGYLGAHINLPASRANSAQPAPFSSTHATSAPLPAPQPAAQPPAAAVASATYPAAAENTAAPEEDVAPDSLSSTKPAGSSSSASKTAAAAKPAAAPWVVKGGSVATVQGKPAATEAPPPSVIGIAAPAASGPLPNLVGSTVPSPVLQRLSISQGVSQGLLIKKVAPAYPANALRMRIEGAVQLSATISKEGNIAEVKVLSGDAQLSRAATDAVKQWKYKPYLLNGEPVEIQTQITINFKLPH
jgi:TonB family protein